MSNDNHRAVTRLEQAATAGVVMLAVGSFVLSYDALHQLAVANHVPTPLAWIWPLIVDGFIITASLAVLHAVLRGRSGLYPWLLLVAFSAMSVAFNILHAPPAPIARLVAAVPPLTLVLSFELLMRQVRDRLAASAPSCVVVEPQLEDPGTAPSRQEQAGSKALAATAGRSLLHQAREIHDQHRHSGTKLTGKTLGQLLGVSDGYARRLLREITTGEPATPTVDAIAS